MFLPLYLILLACFNYESTAESRSNFQVKRYILCNNTQGLFKYFGNISKEGDNYYVDGVMFITLPLDDNVGVSCKIESKVSNMFVELFTIREKNLCKAANMYLGEMWYDIQRGIQAIPGKCPMPPQRYETHHTLIDFNKMSLQTFPFGTLRFTIKLVNNKNPQIKLLCLELEVENVIN